MPQALKCYFIRWQQCHIDAMLYSPEVRHGWFIMMVVVDGLAGRSHQEHFHVMYRKTSNISRTLVGNRIIDNSDVVGASPVGAAPTTSSFST